MSQTLQKFRMKKGSKPLTKPLTWFLSVIMILLGSVFYGCGSHSAKHLTTIQLSTWGSAQEITVLKSLLRAFEREHPTIRVDLLHIPENYYQKLHILIAGDMIPDVIFTNNISFPIYASQGIFRDLKADLDTAGQQDGKQSAIIHAKDFYPAALNAFRWKRSDGTEILGALPRDVSNLVIFYNKDLFREAGVAEPKTGWNWQDFRETAQQLTVDKNNDGTPEQFGISFYATPSLFWLPFVWSANGELLSQDLRHVLLDSPQSVAGLQFYSRLRNLWHVAPQKVESGGATMSQLFMQQKLAMILNGRWSVPVLREQATFDWDVAPLPTGPSGHSHVGIDASGYAISAKSAHPSESLALVNFLLSHKAIEQVAESGLIVPARKDVAESPLFLSPQQLPAHSRVFLDVIPDGVTRRTPPRWNEFSEALNLALEPVWDGHQDAADAIKAVKPKLEQLLEETP